VHCVDNCFFSVNMDVDTNVLVCNMCITCETIICYANPELSGHVEKSKSVLCLFITFLLLYDDSWTWKVRCVKPNAKENDPSTVM
jgi:hypothetical protein